MAKGKITGSTKQVNHESRQHALLSASGSDRWINCTPSARLEESHGSQSSSVFAQEGTLAHELSELYLRYETLGLISASDFESELETIMCNDLFNEEMLEEVPKYVDYCVEQFNAAKAKCSLAVLEVEQKLDFTEYVPESFGTADCCIISDDVLEVIDLKYGKGLPVYAIWNRQLMMYGIGALMKYGLVYDIKEVKVTIVQPRLDNFSTFSISVEELIQWAETELKPRATLAFDGEGELNSGNWCKWCGVKNRCRKLYEKQLEVAKYEFSAPNLLSDEELIDIASRAPQIASWAKMVEEYVKDQAINHGKSWPGFKLVEGKSNRKWLNAETAIGDIIEAIPELNVDDLYEEKPKSLTAIEKLVSKKRFASALGHLVIKPVGAPTLVSVDDPRPALTESASKDFK